MKYYKMTEDMHVDHWMLSAINAPDGAATPFATFLKGQRYDGPTPVSARVYQPGTRRDISYGEARTLVMRRPLAERFAGCDPERVQLVPLRVEGEADEWCVVNVIALLDCLDLTQSEVVPLAVHSAAAGVPKDANYGTVRNLRVDPARVDGAHVFRIKRFWQALIVSEVALDVLRSAEAVGASFRQV